MSRKELERKNKTDNYITCSECGNLNPNDSVFCQICGTKLLLTKYSNDAEEFFNKGVNYSYNKKFENAIECFDKSLELDPNYPEALARKGSLLSDMDNFDEALIYLDKALNIEPNYLFPIKSKGITFTKMGRYSDARKCFKRFQELIKTEEQMGEVKELFAFLNHYSQVNGFDKEKNTDAYLELDDDYITLSWKGIVTNRDKGHQKIKISDITSISLKKGLLLGTIKIYFAGGKIKVSYVDKERGLVFVNQTKNKIDEFKNSNFKTPNNNYNLSNQLDEIKKAKELLDIGAITTEEFEKIKKKFL